QAHRSLLGLAGVDGTRLRRPGRGRLPVRHQPLRCRDQERHPQDRHEGAIGMSRSKSERGQVLVLTVLALTVLLGMTALVLDVGDWFRTKRQLQATADAAALAGAQALPADPGNANSLALNYAGLNGGGVAAADVAITSTNQSN